ncbi:MAG: glycerol-3-phosphate acyltransferase [Clostridia bacterium]|nr:glycerol-3-phosphate acyltransferase [Clostridia bacterium]
MNYLLLILAAYLLGSLNPAALIAKIKHKNLRKHGTGNLGATNVMLNFGKGFGVLVMLFDMAKAALAVAVARQLFPANPELAGLLAGSSAVIGHVFPFYLGFKGGKGLAAFGGLVLAFDPPTFLFLLILGVLLMLVINYSFALPFSAAILFPILTGIHHRSLPIALLAAAISALILFKHAGNLVKAKNGTDVKIREYLQKGHAKHK